MNTLSLAIARRYLSGARTEKNISIMVVICFLGIFISSFALFVVASIMNGFEKVTHQKLQGIHAQIIMRSNGNELNAPKIESIIQKEFPAITSISPSAYKQVILQKEGSQEITNAVILKAINPAAEDKTSAISEKIIPSTSHEKNLTAILNDSAIIIGDKLAHSLGVTSGDSINILYMPEQEIKGKKISLEKGSAHIGGIFSTGIEEFDNGLVIASFDFARRLFDSGVTQINMSVAPHTNEKNIIKQLQKRFGLEVFSWKDLYPALVSALTLEKYAMIFILALIALVASMNIISLIFMQIIQKRPDIAIYKAMGMQNNAIVQLFMAMGIGLAVIAGLCGLFAGYIFGLLLQTYPFIKLPDTYYVSHLPIQMEWYICAMVLALIVCMSVVATWIPCRSIPSISPAQVLRFEG